MQRSLVSAGPGRLGSVLLLAALAACGDQQPLGGAPDARNVVPDRALATFDCTATRTSMTCAPVRPSTGDARGVVLGGQNVFVRLASANASYNAGTETFSVDVTVQNLMNEAIGTPDGVTPDVDGIMVFFMLDPMPQGTGEVEVSNATGTAFFTAANQAYHTYSEILEKDEISSVKTWEFSMDPGVTSFSFRVAIETDVQPMLVINEVLVNPIDLPDAGQSESTAEWFEIYNAGTRTVNLKDLVIADSAASGRRPYHKIASDVEIPSGGYAVLGNNANTSVNGGVTLDYSYGSALALANSLDAIKIARVVGVDTVTVDRTQYSSAGVSAQSGISRELKNPALDNSNMDGSNWDNALVTSVFGPGGRGTPRAQNSTYVP